MSAVRLFFGAVFILSEFTDIYFEIKSVLCFDFYAFGDVSKHHPFFPAKAFAQPLPENGS